MQRTPYGDVPANANNNIRAIRKAKGLTLEELATALETTPQTVQRWETKGDLTVKKLTEVAAVLEVTPAELLPGGLELSAEEQALLARYRRASRTDQRSISALAYVVTERDGPDFEIRKTGND